MSDTSSNTSPQGPVSVLDENDNIQGREFRAAVGAAATGLIQAGVHEGQMRITPIQAVEAAATVYLLVHTKQCMRTITLEIAREFKVKDAYAAIVARPAK